MKPLSRDWKIGIGLGAAAVVVAAAYIVWGGAWRRRDKAQHLQDVLRQAIHLDAAKLLTIRTAGDGDTVFVVSVSGCSTDFFLALPSSVRSDLADAGVVKLACEDGVDWISLP